MQLYTSSDLPPFCTRLVDANDQHVYRFNRRGPGAFAGICGLLGCTVQPHSAPPDCSPSSPCVCGPSPPGPPPSPVPPPVRPVVVDDPNRGGLTAGYCEFSLTEAECAALLASDPFPLDTLDLTPNQFKPAGCSKNGAPGFGYRYSFNDPSGLPYTEECSTSQVCMCAVEGLPRVGVDPALASAVEGIGIAVGVCGLLCACWALCCGRRPKKAPPEAPVAQVYYAPVGS